MYSMLDQFISKSAEHGMIERLLRYAEGDKSSEREAVIQGFFKSIIGKIVPGLQEQCFRQEKNRVTWSSGGGSVNSAQQLLERAPVHKLIYFVQSLIELWLCPNQVSANPNCPEIFCTISSPLEKMSKYFSLSGGVMQRSQPIYRHL